MTHICVSYFTIIGSDNGLSPGRRQAIIWTNAGILLIDPLETNFSENLIGIHTFSFNKIHLKMSSGKCRPFVWPQCVKTVQVFMEYNVCSHHRQQWEQQNPVGSAHRTWTWMGAWITSHYSSLERNGWGWVILCRVRYIKENNIWTKIQLCYL